MGAARFDRIKEEPDAPEQDTRDYYFDEKGPKLTFTKFLECCVLIRFKEAKQYATEKQSSQN